MSLGNSTETGIHRPEASEARTLRAVQSPIFFLSSLSSQFCEANFDGGAGTIEQIANVATLPGIVKYSMAMPDAHLGYGFPIGGVAAFHEEGGVISPGGMGFDINCGVRLLRSNLEVGRVQPLVSTL